jgi:hypothetical protein
MRLRIRGLRYCIDVCVSCSQVLRSETLQNAGASRTAVVLILLLNPVVLYTVALAGCIPLGQLQNPATQLRLCVRTAAHVQGAWRARPAFLQTPCICNHFALADRRRWRRN